MSRYDDHDDYEEFVTATARANVASIKAALATGGEKALQEAIDDLIWAEAERRAEAAADQAVKAERQAWDFLVKREPQFT